MHSASVQEGPQRGWTASAVWRVRLLGMVQADSGNHQLQRFPSRAAALLLARLALAPARSHPREELVELLWPGVALAVGRNRLRQTLSTLKSLLEYGGAAGPGAVLQADRASIRVAPGALACDVHEFEAAVRAGLRAEAMALGAEFMPVFYEDWVQEERQRVGALLDRAAASHAPGAGLAAPPPARLGWSAAAAEAAPATVRLPRYLTRLFGAEPMLQQLQAGLKTERLVTVLGPGGAGKTRLAVEAAGRHAAGDGRLLAQVVFVPLLSCLSQTDLLSAVVAALHLPPASATDTSRLAQSLSAQPSLLVLDNCEQLQDDATATITELLSLAPALQVLATSRRVLALDGEHTVELQPLGVPAAVAPADSRTTEQPTAAQAAQAVQADQAAQAVQGVEAAGPGAHTPAVALFVDRARAARADFRLSARQAGAVAVLVRALGGLPLAIELAACRVRSFSPQEMVQALAEGEAATALDLLSRPGPRSGHDARHASMRRVVAWSWQLLPTELQRLLTELSIFASPFTAAAASAAHGGPAHLALDTLVTHSLLRTEPGDTTRFALQDPVRDFARLQLQDRHGADGPRALRQRVRQWLLGWAQALPAGTPLSAIQNELEQLRALLRSAADDGACATMLQIVLALRLWWDSDGMAAADIDAIEAALMQWPQRADAPQERAQRADVHELLAYLRFGAGDVPAARVHAQQALHWAAEAAAPRARALLRQAWIELASYQAPPALAGSLQEALALARCSDDKPTQARVLHQLAVLELATTEDLQRTDTLLKEAQDLWLQLGYGALAASRQRSRAELLHRQCRWAEAIAIYDACEARARSSGDWVGLIDSALLRGLAFAGQRRWADAAASLVLCARVAWQRHHAHGLAYAVWHQTRVLARLRRPEAAALLLGFAQVYWRQHIGPLSPGSEKHVRRMRALLAAQAGAALSRQWEAQGATLTPTQAMAWAEAEAGAGAAAA